MLTRVVNGLSSHKANSVFENISNTFTNESVEDIGMYIEKRYRQVILADASLLACSLYDNPKKYGNGRRYYQKSVLWTCTELDEIIPSNTIIYNWR